MVRLHFQELGGVRDPESGDMMMLKGHTKECEDVSWQLEIHSQRRSTPRWSGDTDEAGHMLLASEHGHVPWNGPPLLHSPGRCTW